MATLNIGVAVTLAGGTTDMASEPLPDQTQPAAPDSHTRDSDARRRMEETRDSIVELLTDNVLSGDVDMTDEEWEASNAEWIDRFTNEVKAVVAEESSAALQEARADAMKGMQYGNARTLERNEARAALLEARDQVSRSESYTAVYQHTTGVWKERAESAESALREATARAETLEGAIIGWETAAREATAEVERLRGTHREVLRHIHEEPFEPAYLDKLLAPAASRPVPASTCAVEIISPLGGNHVSVRTCGNPLPCPDHSPAAPPAQEEGLPMPDNDQPAPHTSTTGGYPMHAADCAIVRGTNTCDCGAWGKPIPPAPSPSTVDEARTLPTVAEESLWLAIQEYRKVPHRAEVEWWGVVQNRIDALVSSVRREEQQAASAMDRELAALSTDKQTLMTAVTHWRERAEQAEARAQGLREALAEVSLLAYASVSGSPLSPHHRAFGNIVQVVDAALAAAPGDVPAGSLDALFTEIAEWTMATFPSQTPASAVKHAKKEIDHELLNDPANGEEQADVVMLMIAAAASSGNDLKAELRRKLAINRQREWGEPDADGVVEHKRPAPAPRAHEENTRD